MSTPEQESPKLENKPQSPVVAPTNPKSLLTKRNLFFVAVGIVMLFIIFFGSRGKPTKEEQQNTQEPQVTTTNNATAPQLSPQEAAKIEAAFQNERTLADAEEREKLDKMRAVAPVQVYIADGSNINVGGMSETGNGNNGALGGNGTPDPNSQFMNKVSSTTTPTVQATRILHPSTTLAQGTIIWATLETRVVSDLPGMLRAITSEDIYSEDGSNLLLPRGSKLIGQYTSAITQGQRRVFVVWQRAIRPDHIDIQLGSPGTDQLGASGLHADGIDYHFWDQFGNALLLSIIGAGAANIGVDAATQFNSAAAYRDAIAASFSQTAEDTLESTGVIKPTLYVNQGTKINVFVARDLDFYNQLGGDS